MIAMDHTTTKIPPGWSEEIAHKVPFHKWLQSLQLWTLSTEIEGPKQGPAVAQRLGGTAKEIALAQMERPTSHPHAPLGNFNSLQYGEVMDLGDGQGAILRSGLDILVLRFGVEPGADKELAAFQRVWADNCSKYKLFPCGFALCAETPRAPSVNPLVPK